MASVQLLALNSRSSCVHFFAGRVGLSAGLVSLGRWGSGHLFQSLDLGVNSCFLQ